jgi:peptidoglycan/LPS O-acetylase OafA/YrhL
VKSLITPVWGIRLLALWSLVLAVLAVSHLMLLTLAVELYQGENQARMWVIFGLNLIFAVGFGATGYGLWLQHSWGRIAFLWLIGVWSVFNFISLFVFGSDLISGQPPLQWALSGLKYSAALIIPLLYLNLPHIKNQFNKTTELSLTDEKTLDADLR